MYLQMALFLARHVKMALNLQAAIYQALIIKCISQLKKKKQTVLLSEDVIILIKLFWVKTAS